MVTSGSVARAVGCESLRPSIRLHGDSAIEICSLGDAHARRANVAANIRGLTDLDALLGAHVALDAAVDVDRVGVHGGDHFTLGADDDALLVMDGALDAAFDLDVFLSLEFAFETQRRTEDRYAFIAGIVGAAHQFSPWGLRGAGV